MHVICTYAPPHARHTAIHTLPRSRSLASAAQLSTLINTARDGTHRTGHTGRDTQKTRTSHTPKEPHRPTDAPSPRPDSPSPHTERTPPTDRRTTSTTQLTIPATNQPSTHHPNHQATNPPNPRAQLRRRPGDPRPPPMPGTRKSETRPRHGELAVARAATRAQRPPHAIPQ